MYETKTISLSIRNQKILALCSRIDAGKQAAHAAAADLHAALKAGRQAWLARRNAQFAADLAQSK